MGRIARQSAGADEFEFTPFRDADLNYAAQQIAYGLMRVSDALKKAMDNEDGTWLATMMYLRLGAYQLTEAKIESQRTWIQQHLQLARKVAGYPCVDDLFLVRQTLKISVGVIVARLRALDVLQDDETTRALLARLARTYTF